MDFAWDAAAAFLYTATCGCAWTSVAWGSDATDWQRRRRDERLLEAHHAACGCLDRRAPTEDVDAFVRRARTGDLVLFVARAGLKTAIIEQFTHSHIKHVGVVWRAPGAPTAPLLLESTASVTVGRTRYSGPCGTPLAARLHEALHGRYAHYYAAVYVRSMEGDALPPPPLDAAYVRRTWSHAYRASLRTMAMGVYDGPGGALRQERVSTKTAEFCSEYVAELYKAMRLLPSDAAADTEFTPGDFAWPHLCTLADGHRLSPHRLLVFTRETAPPHSCRR